jgi:FkbM family methyltransferase
VLEANVALNRMTDRVTIEPAAAGAAAGSADLFHAGDTSGLSRLGSPNADSPAGVRVRVPVVTLDEYCAAHRLRPDWILVDAEGADLYVLQGAAGLLRDTAAQVVVEMHASLWDAYTTPAAFEGFLASCGRTAVPISGQQRPFADYGTVALLRRGA